MTENKLSRKSMTLIGLASIVLLTLSLYFIFFFHNLEVLVFNKTGYNIDSLKIGSKLYTVKKDGFLLIENCNSISMQGGLPFGFPQASIEGKIKDTFEILLCGTGVETVKNGQFTFDIRISEGRGFYSLYWQHHK